MLVKQNYSLTVSLLDLREKYPHTDIHTTSNTHKHIHTQIHRDTNSFMYTDLHTDKESDIDNTHKYMQMSLICLEIFIGLSISY